MVLTYLHVLDPEIPIDFGCFNEHIVATKRHERSSSVEIGMENFPFVPFHRLFSHQT